MGTSKETLLEEIDRLKKELKTAKNLVNLAKKHHYVHETNSLHCQDGELYIYHNGIGKDERCVVMCVEQLLKDLPFIVEQVVQSNKKMQQMYLKGIKDSLKTL